MKLYCRGCIAVDSEDENNFEGKQVRFRHDPKLLLPSYSYLTQEQVCLLVN